MNPVTEQLYDDIAHVIKDLGEKYVDVCSRRRINYIDHGCRYDQLDGSVDCSDSIRLIELFDKLWVVDYIKLGFQWRFQQDVDKARNRLMQTHGMKFEFRPLEPNDCFIAVELTASNAVRFQIAYLGNGTVMVFAYRSN